MTIAIALAWALGAGLGTYVVLTYFAFPHAAGHEFTPTESGRWVYLKGLGFVFRTASERD